MIRGIAGLLLLALVSAGCGGGESRTQHGMGLTGRVRADGSSTVYPITEAAAEDFQTEHPDVQVTVGISGSGGGFRKFCARETDISDASRPIKASELTTCRANGVEPVEIMVGFDGISMVVNKANDFVTCLTVEELKRIWESGSEVMTWRDVRPEWPDEKIVLYGPGADSGTFDYFTQTIVGEEDASRPDFTDSEDDNVLVQGVAGDGYALGYFGYAYYVENRDKLNLVAIDDGAGCVAPSPETIESRRYSPLARPLFIYIDQASLKRPAVTTFAEFYLLFARELLPQVGYVPLSLDRYQVRIDEIRWRAGQ